MSDHLENELRAALRREDPPEGFAERVLARTHGAGYRPERRARRLPVWSMAAAAACLTMTIGIGEYRERREERARGEAAKQELLEAMRITRAKLRLAQEKVRSIHE
ncbi:MAG: hypothetical protein SFV54_01375 [Bryobacteraceae bacterium]|nr:hypothetical protein [Bryobacteraceae bacterium]